MAKIIYITKDQEKHEAEVDNGYTVMEGAVNNDIDGIPPVADLDLLQNSTSKISYNYDQTPNLDDTSMMKFQNESNE